RSVFLCLHDSWRCTMSAAATAWAWKVAAVAPQKVILLALADSADDAGEARMSRQDLSRKTGLSGDLVAHSIEGLVETGTVDEVERGRFRLALEPGAEERPVPEAKVEPEPQNGLT